MYCLLFHFFFKQKTAYELRISDWSSDVCSSDLQTSVGRMIQTAFFAGCAGLLLFAASVLALPPRMDAPVTNAITPRQVNLDTLFQLGLMRGALRSEERRVGKECSSTGRYRRSPDPYKKNHNKQTRTQPLT